MLTEKECRNALSDLKNIIKDILGDESCVDECIKTLQKLIDEHFDNQPLKFEELKEGMWIWDSQLKWFFRISICNVKIENFEYIKLFKVEKYEGGSMLMFYEPNRFYRKEVQE